MVYMDKKYYLYFDAGTTNTRAYLLDEDFNILQTAKENSGSKDSAIRGSNGIVVDTITSLYNKVLESSSVSEDSILEIFASGMVTSPYGLEEVPHVTIPVTVKDFSKNLHVYRENKHVKRSITLIPGLKTVQPEISLVGNMRGEEIEVMGVLDELKKRRIRNAALVMPGSHTHVAYVRDDSIQDILSTFTGELFCALQKDTILAPILEARTNQLDPEMIALAYSNLSRFGFSRAMYIGHTMRIMDTYTPEQRYAYCEGVINGGVRQGLEYYLNNIWTDCDSIMFICTEYMYKLFRLLFKNSRYENMIEWMPITEDSVYAVKGLKRIVSERNKQG